MLSVICVFPDFICCVVCATSCGVWTDPVAISISLFEIISFTEIT